jgi:hypothetical protein
MDPVVDITYILQMKLTTIICMDHGSGQPLPSPPPFPLAVKNHNPQAEY